MKRRLTQALGGALIYATFGCAFAGYGIYSLARTDLPYLLAIPLAITVIMILALGRYQKKIDALPDDPVGAHAAERDARARQIFTVVIFVQIIAIVVVVRYLNSLHRPEYIAPAASVIAGLHFLALARPMELPSHRIVGALLCVLGLAALPIPPHQSWGVVVGFGDAL